MVPNPTRKGKTSEAIILAALVKLGKHVLVPWGEERYDLALDEAGSLVRLQCKTGHIRDGCVCFKTSITDARRPLGDGGYAGQIDAFAVYCPQVERVYLVPIQAVRTSIGARLRLEPAKNGQTWNVRWARDFELIASDGGDVSP
jgi:PD-(D/E)XK endonuclease